jgi:riboflavin kinase/FMN adenylyltransferase
MDTAAMLLGARYSLTGTVVKGKGRGKSLGFPTANILPDNAEKIVPGNGVYAASIKFSDNSGYNGMNNIGYNPTFDGRSRSIEINIFDFYRDIYGESVTIEFFKRIRDEIKFDSADSLIKQIKSDELQVRKFFAENMLDADRA